MVRELLPRRLPPQQARPFLCCSCSHMRRTWCMCAPTMRSTRRFPTMPGSCSAACLLLRSSRWHSRPACLHASAYIGHQKAHRLHPSLSHRACLINRFNAHRCSQAHLVRPCLRIHACYVSPSPRRHSSGAAVVGLDAADGDESVRPLCQRIRNQELQLPYLLQACIACHGSAFSKEGQR